MTVTLAHTQLLSALLSEPPHSIRGPADACDAAESREHAETIAKLCRDYLADYLRDRNESLPVTSTVNVKYFLDSFDDVISDAISGPLQRAGKLLAEDELEGAA